MSTLETSKFTIPEATINDIQAAFKQNKLTSKQLVNFYINQIHKLNPIYRAVIEINPDAIQQAEKADQERKNKDPISQHGLHGIPVLVKDNIATKDKLNTTAGSYALVNSVVARDAGVVKKLREAGAIIIGKASLSEWAYFRSSSAPSGWNARAQQAVNPYGASFGPCGSSTGSAISVATNMVTVSLGTETDGSILCPSNANLVVGIKPTVGLTSRSGVIPISPRQDTVGPICRTVADAVYVLDAIVGFDKYDAVATRKASKYIPKGGYLKHLNSSGLKGKRLGIMRAYSYFGFGNDTETLNKFNKHFDILRQNEAILIESLEIVNFNHIISMFDGENMVLSAEFKLALNAYLKKLVSSPVRSLSDVIAFNKKHADLERINDYPQDLLLEAEKTNGIGKLEKEALMNLGKASKYGFEKLMNDNKLDALVTPYSLGSSVLAIGGYPGIIVPAGYDENMGPYGICFGGLKGSEPTLIEIAYGFELATNFRKPPPIENQIDVSVAPPATAGDSSGSWRWQTMVESVGGVCVLFIICLVGVCVYQLKHKSSTHSHSCDDDGVGGLAEALNREGNMVISIHDLKNATNNFSQDDNNILGRGGSGTVYKGELQDGTKVAVKRTERINNGGLDEFKSEVAVATKVRHRHLVALRGYSFDANERLLVYEYMPQGTLTRFLFNWKKNGLKPLEWRQRLMIALDVARGVEYLHCLGQQRFIHGDLKPCNILLGDDMRAKVADFGLARPAPDREDSFVTHVAGSFSYLAPEYAEMGEVSTKIDVYSFGVILMELITGRRAIDQDLGVYEEECVPLAKWFQRMYKDEVTFRKAVDPTLDLDEETLDGVITVAELAAHCCACKPNKRPNMSQVVNVLSYLADPWNPFEAEPEPEGVDTHINIDHDTDIDTGSCTSMDGQ